MKRSQARALLLVAALALASDGTFVVESADEADNDDSWRKPVGNRNQFPPSLLVLALEPERGTALRRGESFFSFDFDYSNVISIAEAPNEFIVVDLESARFLPHARVGLGRGVELGAAVPIFYFYGGFLDGFISGFHETFNLPNSVRLREPEDLIRYRYLVGRRRVIDRWDSVGGLGDATVSIKKAFDLPHRSELALRAAVKLPTGSLDHLTGSGATDFGFGVAASRVGRRFGGYFNGYYHVLGRPDASRLATRSYLSLNVGIDARLKKNLAGIIELDHLGRFIESDLPVFNRGALQLVFGLRYRASDRFTYEFRFTEDLSRAAPDFTVGMRWEYFRKAALKR